jgi:predicted house-cleaning noncanonical NTP pyrophosphatase (MazG superfamily)
MKTEKTPTITKKVDMTLARKLTEEQQELFTETFYDLWESTFSFPTDVEVDSPYGCPWTHGGSVKLKGDTVEEMAENFFDGHKEEIQDLIEVQLNLG